MSTLIIIAKECLPGKAKTRLTPPLSPAQAAHIAAASLDQTLTVAAAQPHVRRILYFDGNPASLWAAHPDLADKFEVIPQIDGDLDVRLAHIFDLVRQRYGAAERTALIGMDTPQVTGALLSAVFTDTAAVPAWLGPTADGGFWLIAMGRPTGAAIRGVPMSRDDTGARQQQALIAAGMAPRMLPSLIDMDHWADALAIRDLNPASTFAMMVNNMSAQIEVTSPVPEDTSHQQ